MGLLCTTFPGVASPGLDTAGFTVCFSGLIALALALLTVGRLSFDGFSSTEGLAFFSSGFPASSAVAYPDLFLGVCLSAGVALPYSDFTSSSSLSSTLRFLIVHLRRP